MLRFVTIADTEILVNPGRRTREARASGTHLVMAKPRAMEASEDPCEVIEKNARRQHFSRKRQGAVASEHDPGQLGPSSSSPGTAPASPTTPTQTLRPASPFTLTSTLWTTIGHLAAALKIPESAVVHYVLVSGHRLLAPAPAFMSGGTRANASPTTTPASLRSPLPGAPSRESRSTSVASPSWTWPGRRSSWSCASSCSGTRKG